MKKVFALLVAAGMLAFVACGPSVKELSEKAKADSIKLADSIAKLDTVKKDTIKKDTTIVVGVTGKTGTNGKTTDKIKVK